MTSTPCAASERATARPVMWQLKTRARGSGLDAVKGAVDIGEDVRLVLDANGDAQEAIRDPETLPLLRRKPAVRRDRRVEHFGEKVADRRRGGRELERVQEAEGRGFCVVAKGEGHDASVESTELARREVVLRVIGQTGIADSGDLGVLREVPREREGALALAPDAQR